MSDAYDDEADVQDYDTLAFPACSVSHAHAPADQQDGPRSAVRIVWCEPNDSREVVGEVFVDPEFARKLATELVRQADLAESCMETHPDLLEFKLP